MIDIIAIGFNFSNVVLFAIESAGFRPPECHCPWDSNFFLRSMRLR